MKLTKAAEELKLHKEEGAERTQRADELAQCMGSENFGYALYEGGYLRPQEWVEGEDLEKLKDAIRLVGQFKNLVESLHDEI